MHFNTCPYSPVSLQSLTDFIDSKRQGMTPVWLDGHDIREGHGSGKQSSVPWSAWQESGLSHEPLPWERANGQGPLRHCSGSSWSPNLDLRPAFLTNIPDRHICCHHPLDETTRDEKVETRSEEHLIFLACCASLALLCMRLCNPVCSD